MSRGNGKFSRLYCDIAALTWELHMRFACLTPPLVDCMHFMLQSARIEGLVVTSLGMLVATELACSTSGLLHCQEHLKSGYEWGGTPAYWKSK